MKDIPVIKNQVYQISIIDLTYEGLGVAKLMNFPIFVANALVGEEVVARITKVDKKYAFATTEEIIKSSPQRLPLPEGQASLVGTMPLQHLAYSEQLRFKEKLVRDAMERIGKLEVEVLPIIGMEEPKRYRNKAQVPVQEVDSQLVTGSYLANSRKLVALEDYLINDPLIDATINKVRIILAGQGVRAYDERQGKGDLRHIIVRRGYYTGEQMLILVTRSNKPLLTSEVIKQIVTSIPGIVSIVQNIQPKATSLIMGEEQKVLYGEDVYHDRLLDLNFQISAKSFYQVNTKQTEVLYQLALERAQLSGDEIVIDAYCGIGTLSLLLAQKAKFVFAMEITPDAVAMARRNAESNQIENVQFEVGSAEVILPKWQDQGLEADVLLVDPPRKGLDRQFIDASIALAPQRIVYVSCNPATLARDLAIYKEAGYEIGAIQPVDMFPQTNHVEAVVLMSRVDK